MENLANLYSLILMMPVFLGIDESDDPSIDKMALEAFENLPERDQEVLKGNAYQIFLEDIFPAFPNSFFNEKNHFKIVMKDDVWMLVIYNPYNQLIVSPVIKKGRIIETIIKKKRNKLLQT